MSSVSIIHIISSLNRGGRERQFATIYKFSDKSKISTKIICLNRTPISYFEEYGMQNDIAFLTSKNPLKRVFEIRKFIKENNADIIWTWGGIEASFGLILSLTSRVKHINGSIRHGIVRFNKHQLWRLVVLHVSKNIVANSQAGLNANRLKRGFVLYNGIGNEFFMEPGKEPYMIRKEFGIRNDIILMLSVANLIPIKDYNTVLRALDSVKSQGIPFHYIAIGEGKERKRIEELAAKLNLSKEVSFPGIRKDIKDFLYASDIFIHSSRGEGCSNAILEAISAGLPIIASDTGGTNEIVDASIGRLFQFQNVDQLVKEILSLISNKSLRAVLGENAKKKALSSFSIEKMMSNYYRIVEKVI